MNEKTFGRRDLFKKAATATGAAGVGLGITLAQDATAQDAAPVLAAKVPTHKLGTTGEDIPILLMGGSQKFDPTFDKMLHRAHKIGMFYIDTGKKYANGQSHVTLKPFIEQVGRDNVWITSKSGLWGSNNADPASRYYDDIQKEFKVLGTDHLDMYFMHGIKHVECLGPEYLAMGDKLKKDGQTKYFGFSCHDGNVVELLNKAATIGSDGVNAIMFRYNFTMYGDLELNKAMDACVKAGIGLIAMKTQTAVPEDSEKVAEFKSANFTLHQARLKAAWADERIDACVSGINNMKILKENSNAARSEEQLTASEISDLFRYAAETSGNRCQGCSHICESRVDGELKISDQLRYLMYDECYGEKAEARQLYQALSTEQREFRSVNLVAATQACPQRIDIAKRLGEAESRLA